MATPSAGIAALLLWANTITFPPSLNFPGDFVGRNVMSGSGG